MKSEQWVAVAAAVQAFATVVLVWLTACYVKQTRRLAELAGFQLRRERSEAAALAARDALLVQQFTEHVAMVAFPKGVVASARRELERSYPLIDDPSVRERVHICAATFVAAAIASGGAPVGMYALKTREVAKATRAQLEAYLSGEPGLPAWTTDLPQTVAEATSWIERAG